MREIPNNVLKFVKQMENEGRNIEGGRCIGGRDGRLHLEFSEKKDFRKIWNDLMEKIMYMTEVGLVGDSKNKENETRKSSWAIDQK